MTLEVNFPDTSSSTVLEALGTVRTGTEVRAEEKRKIIQRLESERENM
jgi:hypothetical protein